MRIRLASLEDTAAISSCVAEAYQGYVRRIGRPPASMERDFRSDIDQGNVYVCESAGEIVGIMVVRECPDHVEVSSLAVRPNSQRQGFGRSLMSVAEGRASSRGLSAVRLYTNAALPEVVRYYERLGYVQYDRRTDDGYDRVFFEKDVGATA